MTFEAGLRIKLLAAASGITTIVSPVLGRPGTDKSVNSAPLQIVYRLVSRVELEALNAPNPFRQPVFDIDCVGRWEDYDDIVALADAVEIALSFATTGFGDLEGISASVREVSDRDIDAEAGIVARSLQVQFGYRR